ncbi:MAG TPA: alpha/beta hydrolase [Candidatus Acidoferrales bacterium]|nr:alpha/beta hydrolase [Candidatus Acidoferrales bacterium]
MISSQLFRAFLRHSVVLVALASFVLSTTAASLLAAQRELVEIVPHREDTGNIIGTARFAPSSPPAQRVLTGLPVPDGLVQLFEYRPSDEQTVSSFETQRLGATPMPFASSPNLEMPGIDLSPNSRELYSHQERFPLAVLRTDVNGRFVFPLVIPGKYLITTQFVADDGRMLFAGGAIANVSAGHNTEITVATHDVVWQPLIRPPSAQLTQTVFYLTDRNDATAASRRFEFTKPSATGTEYGTTLMKNRFHFGECTAELNGQLRVHCTEFSDADGLVGALHLAIAHSPSRELIVFSHGFAQSFDDAIHLSALLANVTQRPVLAYDWASADSLLAYTDDAVVVQKSLEQGGIRDVIKVVSNFGSRCAFFVGHSMGARAAYGIAKEIVSPPSGAGKNIGGTAYFAGDLFEATFKSNFAALAAHSDVSVNYSSERDVALLLSLAYHPDTRIGQTFLSPIYAPDLQSIDASRAGSGLIGHGYINDPALLEDLAQALDGVRPSARADLSPFNARLALYDYHPVVQSYKPSGGTRCGSKR